MRKSLMTILVFPIVLAGCVATMTGAQQRSNQINGVLVLADLNRQNCLAFLGAGMPSVEAKLSEVFIMGEGDPEKFTKLASKTFLSDELRPAYLKWIAEQDKCDRSYLSEVSPVFSEGAAAFSQFLDERDKLRLLLLEGRITISDFYHLNKDANRIATEQWRAAAQRVNQVLSQAHDAEVAQRQAAWAAYSQSMAAAAQRNAQILQNMQNSIQQNQPVYTNCYKAGITINCVSR